MHLRNISPLMLLIICAFCPVLKGAGCTTHYSGNLKGTVAVPSSLAAAHKGQNVTVLYRVLKEGETSCTKDWEGCLSDPEQWRPLHACSALENSGQQPTFVLAESGAGNLFDACTDMVGVYYKADVIAFIDADGDGVLDPDERWGGFKEGPIARDVNEANIRIMIPPAP